MLFISNTSSVAMNYWDNTTAPVATETMDHHGYNGDNSSWLSTYSPVVNGGDNNALFSINDNNYVYNNGDSHYQQQEHLRDSFYNNKNNNNNLSSTSAVRTLTHFPLKSITRDIQETASTTKCLSHFPQHTTSHHMQQIMESLSNKKKPLTHSPNTSTLVRLLYPFNVESIYESSFNNKTSTFSPSTASAGVNFPPTSNHYDVRGSRNFATTSATTSQMKVEDEGKIGMNENKFNDDDDEFSCCSSSQERVTADMTKIHEKGDQNRGKIGFCIGSF